MTRTVGKHLALAAPYGGEPKRVVALDVGHVSLSMAVLTAFEKHRETAVHIAPLADADFAEIEKRYLATTAAKKD